MKRKFLLVTIIGLAVAIIIAMAIITHLKLSALEPEGHGDESVKEVLNEIVTRKPSHLETITEEELNHNSNIETSH